MTARRSQMVARTIDLISKPARMARRRPKPKSDSDLKEARNAGPV